MEAIPSFDLVVIGSGPAGQKGAVAAAKLGRSVAVVDRRAMLGGVSLHHGTIPSKTLREAILYLTGFRQRAFYGQSYTLQRRIDVEDLRMRVRQVVERQTQVVADQLRRNGVTLKEGTARFTDPHTLRVEGPQGVESLRGTHILIACGTRAARDPAIPFDGSRILVADELGNVEHVPQEAIVVGAGVIGLEYACMLQALGVQVTIIEQRPTLLDFVDREIVDALCYHMRRLGAVLRLGEKVQRVDTADARVTAHLESGKQVHGEMLLYAVGRQANTDSLDLAAAGLAADTRGRMAVNADLQTAVPHIYAAGDVIGFPALASTSMDQGRRAGAHMFGTPSPDRQQLQAFGIYTIPEISMVGKTEQQLTEERIPYEIGLAKYEELAKGQIAGDSTGVLKLLFHRESLALLGVHALGESAAELIHIGQAVLSFGGAIPYFRDIVFNYPTFAEAYKVAALDGLNRLR